MKIKMSSFFLLFLTTIFRRGQSKYFKAQQSLDEGMKTIIANHLYLVCCVYPEMILQVFKCDYVSVNW